DNGGAMNTDSVVITVTTSDTTPPSAASVNASMTSLEVGFNEPVDRLTTENKSNYTINNSIVVDSATLMTDNKTVMLTITTEHLENVQYTLTVKNIKDLTGNIMAQQTVTYEYDYGLANCYRFNEGSSNTTVCMQTGAVATLVNGPIWSNEAKESYAIDFDGNDDAVEIPATFTTQAGSLSMWVYPRSFGYHYIFGHATQPWSNLIQLYTDNSGYLQLGLGDNHTCRQNIYPLLVNTWFHIVLTWDGANYKIYVDGISKAEGSYSGLAAKESYADVGNNGNRSVRVEAFDGMIDEFYIFDRPLSEPEVLDLFNNIGDLLFEPIGDKQVNEGSTLTFTIVTADPATEVVIADHNLPTEPVFANKTFSWTPGYDDSGVYEVMFLAAASQFEDVETINITVNNVNRKPVINCADQFDGVENSILSFAVTASDSDGDTVTISATNLPQGASFASGSFNWQPAIGQAGTYDVTFTAGDGQTSTSKIVTITINATTQTTYEAENALLSGPIVDTFYNGYTGTGFADYLHSFTDYVEWTVNVGSSGKYELQFRYALLSGDRPLQIKVNGQVVVNSLSFPATGSWTSWGIVSTIATLNNGQNTIRATAIGSSAANLDNLKVIACETVSTPTISPNGGTFTGSTQVTLSCSTSDAAIRYTTNGTDPTSSSPLYSSPFTVSDTCTVKARGFKNDYTDSSVASASFIIQSVPTQTIYEAENALLSGTVVETFYKGYTGTGYADYINSRKDYIEWTVDVSTSGEYELQFRYALLSGDRPLQIKINGKTMVSSLSFPATGSRTSWGTVSTTVTLNSGQNTIRATAIGSSGANLDHLNVISQ
ncbi:MAG: carbohydrate-binding protein, partial [Phycisphaerae bacterium]|nr:carbohydrate-binding protein [Phycisphaerae bacterium]